MTPMEDGLRIAGTVELAGLTAQPNYERADMMLGQAQRLLPGLRGSGTSRWMGHRPSLPIRFRSSIARRARRTRGSHSGTATSD